MLKNPAENLYEVAAQQLMAAGIHHVDLAYAFFFNMNPRTVRRIFERCQCLMCDGLEESSTDQTYPLGTTDLDDLAAAAREAGVPAKVALSAVLRFGNPLGRVRDVLRDIRTLVVSQCAPRNAPGLFVSLMRSGEGVVLPERVLVGRENALSEARKREEAERLAREMQAQAWRASAQAQATLDASALTSPAEQWRERGPGLRLLLRGWGRDDLARLERACCAGLLSAAGLAREGAAAQARGEVRAWGEGVRVRLG